MFALKIEVLNCNQGNIRFLVRRLLNAEVCLVPIILSSLALRGLSTEDREVARQRRRSFQESRRQSKVLVRRTRLPSISDARSSKIQNVSGSIDFLTASSTSSSYDVGSSLGSAPYGRTNSVSSTHGPYMGGISA